MIIYTCLVGDIDKLEDPQQTISGVDYICFSDKKRESNIWSIHPLLKDFGNSRLTARYHKIMSHKIFTDDTLWVDGKIKLKKNIPIDQSKQIILAKHPARSCIYEEASKVIELNKETPYKIHKIIESYKKNMFPKNIGLFETSVVFRKYCEKNEILEEKWWEEIKKCIRDQISLPYVLWILNYKPNIFNFDIFSNDYFKVEHHKTEPRKNVKIL